MISILLSYIHRSLDCFKDPLKNKLHDLMLTPELDRTSKHFFNTIFVSTSIQLTDQPSRGGNKQQLERFLYSPTNYNALPLIRAAFSDVDMTRVVVSMRAAVPRPWFVSQGNLQRILFLSLLIRILPGLTVVFGIRFCRILWHLCGVLAFAVSRCTLLPV